MALTSKIMKRFLFRVTWGTALIFATSFAVQLYFTRWYGRVEPVKVVQKLEVQENSSNVSKTIWELIEHAPDLSFLVEKTLEIPRVRDGLDSRLAKFTVYAPTNKAFENERLPYDVPSFGWLMLVGYHMAPGAFSRESHKEKMTVASFLHADRFFKYKQRISTQTDERGLSLNSRARFVGPEIVAANGYIHRLDHVLTIPEAVAIILRDTPEFSIFRHALIKSGVAVHVNDTSHHDGQTVFAPTNAAFKKLSPKVERFLFSAEGSEYLEALMKYHIASNRTMFSDTFYEANGGGEVMLTAGSTVTLPTLAKGQDLHTAIDIRDLRKIIMVNSNVRVSTQDIVAMDGVVHAVDTLLLPTQPLREDVDESNLSLWVPSWLPAFLRGSRTPEKITITTLRERLYPLLEGSNGS